VRTPFPGNVIPSQRLSTISQSLASYLPAPTNGGIQNNYLAVLPQLINNDSTTNKLDYNVSDRNRAFAFFSTGKYTTNFTGSYAPGTSALPLPYTQSRFVTEYSTTGQVHDIYTLRPNLLNQFSLDYNRMYIPLGNPTAGGDYPTKAGITGLPPGIASSAMPDVNFAGLNTPISWAGTNAHVNTEAANTFDVQNNILWTKGKHFITVGFQFQALQDNYNNPLTGTLASFSFSNNETANFNSAGALVSTTGLSYASYLLGLVDSSGVTQNAVAETGGRYKTYAAYIQDDIKVSQRLTLNVGLRWNVWGPFKEVYNRMSFFNPELPNPLAGNRLGALQFAGNGTDGCNCSTPIKTHYINPGPRLGLAYRLGEKTVIRAGYSLVYAHAGGVGGRTNGRQGLSQLGFNTSASFSSVATGQPAFNWANGYPSFQPAPFLNPSYGIGFITAAAGAPIAGPGTAQTITYGDPQIGGKPPYYENWNLNVQHSLTPSLTLSVAYSGSSGHFLPGAGNAGPFTNQIPLQYITLGPLLGQTLTAATLAQAQASFPNIGIPFPNFTGTIAQALKPYPQYNGISNPWANLGISTYNALQTTLVRRFAQGLTFTLAYTYSKQLDDLVGSPRNPFNNALEKGPGTIDHPHVGSLIFVYQLPFGAGHKLNSSSKALSAVMSHWQLSGLATYSSGAPLVIGGTCTSGGILGTCYPNYNPAFSGSIWINGDFGSGGKSVTSTAYLDKTAFVDPAAYTVGNIARSAPFGLFSPHNADVDLSVRREFKVREQVRLALQADAFNVNNAVHFGTPGTNIDSAAFGTVTTMANQPRKLQFSGRISF
jgi:hypothetical protein